MVKLTDPNLPPLSPRVKLNIVGVGNIYVGTIISRYSNPIGSIIVIRFQSWKMNYENEFYLNGSEIIS